MNGTYNKYFFNEFYEENGGGNYTDRDHWKAFFDMIAKNIVESFQPKTVLDAGCACGYLVEALRDRGVEAYGIDISEYAIGIARDDIKAYLNVQSITEKLPLNFPEKFDLVVTIEVMEHLFPEDGAKAIELLCSYSDTVIFTSTPSDFDDRTHVNVQQKEYWAKLFAENSFYRDLIQPVDFICEWALLFRKKDNVPGVIFDYELCNRIEEARCKSALETKVKNKGYVYYDYGNGYSEEYKEVFEYQGGRISTNRLIIPEGCKEIRIDPIKNQFCILRDLQVRSDLGRIDVCTANNNDTIGNMYYFKTMDSRLICQFNDKTPHWIELLGDALLLEDNTELEVIEEVIEAGKSRVEQALLEGKKKYEEKVKEAEEEKQALIREQEQALSDCKKKYEEKAKEAEEEKQTLIREQEQALSDCEKKYEEKAKEAEEEKQALIRKQEQALSDCEKKYEEKAKEAEKEKQALIREQEQVLSDCKKRYEEKAKKAEEEKQALIRKQEQALFICRKEYENVEEEKEKIEKILKDTRKELDNCEKEQEQEVLLSKNLKQELEQLKPHYLLFGKLNGASIVTLF